MLIPSLHYLSPSLSFRIWPGLLPFLGTFIFPMSFLAAVGALVSSKSFVSQVNPDPLGPCRMEQTSEALSNVSLELLLEELPFSSSSY